MKHLPLVIAVLLVTTVTGVGVGFPAESGIQPQADTADTELSAAAQLDGTIEADASVTNALAIPAGEIERSDLRRQYADLGPAAGFDTGVTTDRLATRTIERELDDTADSELESRVLAELDAVEAEVDELESRERAAIRAFSSGETEPRELLVELATIHLTASELRDRTALLESYASTLDEGTISEGRILRLEYDTLMLEGPLRAHVVSVLRAERPPDRILIETSQTAITMTTIDADRYLREVNRKGLRGDGSSQL